MQLIITDYVFLQEKIIVILIKKNHELHLIHLFRNLIQPKQERNDYANGDASTQ